MDGDGGQGPQWSRTGQGRIETEQVSKLVSVAKEMLGKE